MMIQWVPYQVMIQTWWWSSDALDQVMIQWWSKLDDDPMMLKTKWWSSDAPDQVTIQTWWRWLEDEDDLKMKMTWWWSRWYKEEDLCWRLCQKNTFLVKRECWCICNFGMYSLVYLMYCTLMFILGSIYNVIESCNSPMFRLGDSIM